MDCHHTCLLLWELTRRGKVEMGVGCVPTLLEKFLQAQPGTCLFLVPVCPGCCLQGRGPGIVLPEDLSPGLVTNSLVKERLSYWVLCST